MPIAGVRVTPASFHLGAIRAQWSDAITNTWTIRTDNNGVGVIHGLPSDYSVSLYVHSDLYVQPGDTVTPESPAGALVPLTVIQVQDGGVVAGKILSPANGKSAQDVLIQALSLGNSGGGGGITHADGSFKITGLPAGRYEIQAEMPSALKSHWSIAPQVVDVGLNANPRHLDLPLVPCCVITGTVTDKKTGSPVPNVWVVPVYTALPAVHFHVGVRTDADGNYAVYVAPSRVTMTLSASNMSSDDQTQKDVTAVGGATVKLDFQITHPGPWTIDGDVVDADGHPVPNAYIQASAENQAERVTTSDDHGHFIFQSIDLGYSITARTDTLASASPLRVSGPDPISVKVVPGLLCKLHGMLDIQAGASAKVASVELYDGSGRLLEEAAVDRFGAYAFRPTYANQKYKVEAKMPHYGNADSGWVVPTASQDVVFPILELVKADSSVAGTVVDRFGHPISGAEVHEESIDGLEAITDPYGRFSLAGVPEGHSLLWVIAPAGRRGELNAKSGSSDLLIKVMSDDEQAASTAEMDALEHSDPNLRGNGKDAAVLLSEAEQRSALTGKKIFLVFGASWCGDCYRFARFLETPQVKSIMDENYIVLRMDVFENNNKGWENPGGLDIYKKYGGTSTVPFWTVLDQSGKQLYNSIVDGQNQGFSPEPTIVDYFFHVLKSTAPLISDRNYAQLRLCLRYYGDD